jgi:hypothetical protein
MITLTVQALQMTGAELLDLLKQQRQRHTGDLQIGDMVWRVYSSSHRGRGPKRLHLWREEDKEGAPVYFHVQGQIDQRIVEMRQVRSTVE